MFRVFRVRVWCWAGFLLVCVPILAIPSSQKAAARRILVERETIRKASMPGARNKTAVFVCVFGFSNNIYIVYGSLSSASVSCLSLDDNIRHGGFNDNDADDDDVDDVGVA